MFIRTETRRDCGAFAAWDFKKSDSVDVSPENKDNAKYSVEVWDINESGEFMIGKAEIDIKSIFEKSNLYKAIKIKLQAKKTGSEPSADVVLSVEARR